MVALPPLLETALLASIVLVAGYADGDGTRTLPHSWPHAAQRSALIVAVFRYWFHRWSMSMTSYGVYTRRITALSVFIGLMHLVFTHWIRRAASV